MVRQSGEQAYGIVFCAIRNLGWLMYSVIHQ